MASSGSDDDSLPRYQRHSLPTRLLHPRPSNHSQASISVPSLYEAFEAAHRNNLQQQQLAFTSEELELSKPSLGPPPYRISSAPHTGKHRRVARHGQMIPADGVLITPNSTNPSCSGSGSTKESNSSIPVRARPTVTTILRHKHVLEKVEQKEKDKVDLLMLSSCSLVDVDSLNRELDKKQAEEAKTAEAKRHLQARLAYERAIAASRKVTDNKQKIGESTRLREKEWQALREKQREQDTEKRKSMTESLQRAVEDSRRSFDEMLRLKQIKAIKVKEETEQLQAEARRKQILEEKLRHDKIQQIQAAKLALKKTKKSSSNPNQFYRSIAVPETQIKLRLQREEAERRLEETRKKIQAEKQVKSVKLIKAMKKIQSHESVLQAQKKLSYHQDRNNSPLLMTASVAQSPPSRKSPSPSKLEIDEMIQELKILKSENLQRKQISIPSESQKRSTAGTPTASKVASNIRLVGVGNLKNNFDQKSVHNFYPNNSTRAITVGKH